MLFIPYALHDRDAYARTAREKFESLGKAGPAAAATPAVPGAAGPVPGRRSRLRARSGPRQPWGTRAGLGRAAAARAARAVSSRSRLRTSAWKEMF